MILNHKSQKIRFIMVGGINTLIDFGLLFTLKTLGLPTIPANIISTTAAFCFSFFANKKYTFKSANADIKREIILFLIVTLFGLWALQTIVIQFVTFALVPIGLQATVILLVAKACATIVSLTWNYALYSRLVFIKRH